MNTMARPLFFILMIAFMSPASAIQAAELTVRSAEVRLVSLNNITLRLDRLDQVRNYDDPALLRQYEKLGNAVRENVSALETLNADDIARMPPSVLVVHTQILDKLRDSEPYLYYHLRYRMNDVIRDFASRVSAHLDTDEGKSRMPPEVHIQLKVRMILAKRHLTMDDMGHVDWAELARELDQLDLNSNWWETN